MLTTLQGLKVLDFGLYFAGPYASRLLADLGAEVIKLEALDGDTLRPTTKPFNAAARGKRSIAVDLKSDAGREVAHRIAAQADVVTHNMRPGVAERLGMGYDTIRGLNPEVIYSYAPGWGSSGPDAARSGFAPLFSGFVGLHHESAGDGNIPTPPPGNEDNGNGLLGAAAILFALYHRARTGKGQYLEHPQLNATMLMGLHLMRGADGSVVGATGLDHGRRGVHPLDRLYRTADGWLCISARTDAEFARLGGVPAFAEVGDDPRFADGDSRLAHRPDLEAALTTIFATTTTEEWVDVLEAARVACAVPAGPERPSQILDDPEQVRLGRVERYEHPRWGQVSDIAVMVRMGDAQTAPGRPAPEIGQHTREVLTEFGYDPAEIESLYDQGAVR